MTRSHSLSVPSIGGPSDLPPTNRRSGGDPFSHSRDRLTAAVTSLQRAGSSTGVLRSDVTPDDVLVSLSGLSLATTDRHDREQASRLLDLLMDALRSRRRP